MAQAVPSIFGDGPFTCKQAHHWRIDTEEVVEKDDWMVGEWLGHCRRCGAIGRGVIKRQLDKYDFGAEIPDDPPLVL